MGLLDIDTSAILDRLLSVFLKKRDAKKPVIFTISRERWNDEENPEFVSDAPLPTLEPSCPDPLKSYFVRQMENYVHDAARRKLSYSPFRVKGFPSEHDRKVHFVFTDHTSDLPPNLEERYLKSSRPYEMHRTASAPSLTPPVPVQQSTDVVIDIDESRPTSPAEAGGQTATRSMLKRDSSVDSAEEMQSKSDNSSIDEALSVILSRFDDWLLEDLTTKLVVFVTRLNKGKRAAVIFTDDVTLWRAEENTKIVACERTSPIPAGYDMEKFDIARDIEECILGMAKHLHYAQFFASCLKLRGKNGVEVHLLLSPRDETLESYYDGVYATCETAPGSGAMMVTDEGRRGPSTSTEQSAGTDSETRAKRRRESVRVLKHQDTLAGIEDIPPYEACFEEELRVAASRIGADELRTKLDLIIDLFLKRGERAKNAAVIFTSKTGIWKADTYAPDVAVVNFEDPHFRPPSSYDERKFDLAGDVVCYLAGRARELSNEPCTASSLQFGDKDYLDMHLVMSPYEEHALNYLNYRSTYYHQPLPSGTTRFSAVMVSEVYNRISAAATTVIEKGTVMVKQVLRNCPVPGRGGSRPSTEYSLSSGDDQMEVS